MVNPYRNTMKSRVSDWIMAHQNGKRYSVKHIGRLTKASPPTVRSTIKSLVNTGMINAVNSGSSRQSRWRFYPR